MESFNVVTFLWTIINILLWIGIIYIVTRGIKKLKELLNRVDKIEKTINKIVDNIEK